MLKKNFIKMNNSMFQMIQRRPFNPENVLLLFPHCLQASDCKQNVTQDLKNCLRCGKCKVSELLKIQDELKVSCFLAAGGRQAVAMARQPWVKAIIAIACEKELFEGIMATAPKPVYAIYNSQPYGFCKNTDVDIVKIRQAIYRFVRSDRISFLECQH